MIRALGRLALAILLAATAGPVEVTAGTQMSGYLDCGFDNCADMFLFTCSATKTKYVQIHACDGDAFDDRFTLIAWRTSSDANDGKGAMDSVQLANACANVVLTRPTPGVISGLAVVTAPGNFWPFDYRLSVYCLDADRLELPNPGLTRTTDQ